MMFAEFLAQEQLHGMAQRAGAEFGGCRWKRRDIQNGCRGRFLGLRTHSVFEASAGIASSRDTGVTLDGNIEKPQFQILEHAPFKQAVDVLVGAGKLKSIFDFENSTLHCFGSAGKRRAVGNSRYLVLLRVRAGAGAWCLGVVRFFLLSLWLIRFLIVRLDLFLADCGCSANAG